MLLDLLENPAADRADLPAYLKVRCAFLMRLEAELEDGIARLSKSIEAKPGTMADEADSQTTACLSGSQAKSSERPVICLG